MISYHFTYPTACTDCRGAHWSDINRRCLCCSSRELRLNVGVVVVTHCCTRHVAHESDKKKKHKPTNKQLTNQPTNQPANERVRTNGGHWCRTNQWTDATTLTTSQRTHEDDTRVRGMARTPVHDTTNTPTLRFPPHFVCCIDQRPPPLTTGIDQRPPPTDYRYSPGW